MKSLRLCAFLLLAYASGHGLRAREVWLDDAPGGGGNGTQAAPYHWGNSADLFDTGMRSFEVGTAIHLLHVRDTKYVFQTRGAYANSVNSTNGFQLKSEQQILGYGGATLQLVYLVPDRVVDRGFNIALGAVSSFFTGGATANNVVIENLVLDCNGPALKAQRPYCTVQAIELAGTRNVLRNVTVLNAINDRALVAGYDENFLVSLSCYETNSSSNIIDRCTVRNFYADKSKSAARNIMCSAICMRVRPKGFTTSYRISGSIQNCLVYLNGFEPGAYVDQEYALNATFTSELAVTGNIVFGATRGFNNDAGPNECLLIAGNTFTQPSYSCGVFLSASNDSVLRDNRFNLQGTESIAIKVQGPVQGQEAVRWRIQENTIFSAHAGNSGIYFHPSPKPGPGMPTYIDVQENIFLGEPSFIHVPRNVARGSNHFARNSGKFRYYSSLSEPVGNPLQLTNRCPTWW